ncbi:carbohydrate ABC transporter membrane protein 1, CUT1 family (TC 3.A.1.1.-) [Paenibacillus sp. 1_12]|uniref:ABC transporter permease n=1 Tax=Paenibacillus sp. 1_12 TaxID=1566278 RepID=UPI0008ECE4CD|nr:ABC transporter permease subunit [Paenibacillus sp. 1_12]SFL58343.1 carbohydrate ABC transporter membrane protein 1, CUT1 family (TC 3.A.1.1.-) [Paenibacillus sp. 1_12]
MKAVDFTANEKPYKPTEISRKERVARSFKKMVRDRWLYFMIFPGLVYYLIFKYGPMWGISIAFQDYSPFLGISGSKWTGMKHFIRLFQDPAFYMLLKNTLLLSLANLVFAFPMPIIVALMLNELRKELFKKWIQTMIYIPHFMSWVIIVGMFFVLFESRDGLFQKWIVTLGLEPFTFMMDPQKFRPLYVIQIIWRDTGWGTIIYLAALAGIDPQLYEAAKIDGAGRLRQMWSVTLPSIRSTIVILFILRLGDILDLGFEHAYLLLNPLNREVAEIFDTYVYTMGIIQGSYSYSTAIGLFKSGIGLVLVLMANTLSKKWGEEGIL